MLVPLVLLASVAIIVILLKVDHGLPYGKYEQWGDDAKADWERRHPHFQHYRTVFDQAAAI